MSDIASPTAPAPVAAPPAAAPVVAPAPVAPAQGQPAPVQVHVHNAAPPSPAAPAAAPPAAPQAPAPAPAKPAYVNPYAAPKVAAAPAPAAPAGQVAPPVAAAPVAPPAPVVDPQVAALTERLDGLRSVVALTSQREVNALPENLRTYVLAQAGDDPVKQINAIETLRSHGMIPAATQVVPQGATTTTGAPAPAPVQTPANPDAQVLAQYEALKGSPLAQGLFANAHRAAIVRARSARPS